MHEFCQWQSSCKFLFLCKKKLFLKLHKNCAGFFLHKSCKSLLFHFILLQMGESLNGHIHQCAHFGDVGWCRQL